MIGGGAGQVDRAKLYDRTMILHSVPRFNNPSGTFDNDQYLVEIVTVSDLAGKLERANFLTDFNTVLSSCGNGCETQAGEEEVVCPTPSLVVV